MTFVYLIDIYIKKYMTYNQLTKESFIEKAKKIHGDKFDYSKVDYTNTKTKVCIVCPIHGEFWQTPGSHLAGRGCNLCSKPVYDTASFIQESIKKYGNTYDYSKVEYIDSHTKVCVLCPEHGEFWVTPNNHLKGRGCYKCGRELSAKKQALTTEEFIKKAREIHGNKYDYSKTEYINNHTEVCVICPEHGKFWQKPMKHLSGQGCLKCSESNLEREIRVTLEENDINYIQQCDHTVFKWLKKQRLDFYLPEYNTAIECQGEQHYYPVSFGETSHSKILQNFKNVLMYDERKKNACNVNNIRLLYYTTEKLKKNNEFTDKNKLLNEIKNV